MKDAETELRIANVNQISLTLFAHLQYMSLSFTTLTLANFVLVTWLKMILKRTVMNSIFFEYRDIAITRMLALEENNKLLRQQAEANHRLMQQMARLLKRVADEGDLIGEECQSFLDQYAESIPF